MYAKNTGSTVPMKSRKKPGALHVDRCFDGVSRVFTVRLVESGGGPLNIWDDKLLVCLCVCGLSQNDMFIFIFVQILDTSAK